MNDDDRTIHALTQLVAKLWHDGAPGYTRRTTYSAGSLDAWAANELDDDERAALNGSLGQSFGDRLLPGDRRAGWDSDHPISRRIYATVDDA